MDISNSAVKIAKKVADEFKKKKKKKGEEEELELIKPSYALMHTLLITDAHDHTLSLPDELTVLPDSVVTYPK